VSGMLRDLRILLVEDGKANQTLILHVLRKAGAEVDLAENGREAVERALLSPRDAIVMDMQMPVMDGYEATSRLRAAGLEIPIVALTAHAMSGDRERCLDAGCSAYCTKPIDRLQLCETLRCLVAKSREV